MNTNESHALPREMKALRAHARGGPERLVYEDAPTPPLRDGSDVLVRVTAAGITVDELTWPETWEANGHDRTPIIPSHELAGVVAVVGPDVRGLAVGDAVFGLVPFDRDGAAAQYVAVPAASLARRPPAVSDVVAAGAVLPALTALEALAQHAQVHAGQRLLVRGGTGAVGSFLTQLARARGIRVTATVHVASSAARATRLGAAEVVVADQSADIPPASFDAAIDAAGAGSPEWLYRAVRPGGRVITLQEAPDTELAASIGVEALFFVVSTGGDEIEHLADLLATGTVDVAIGQTLPLSDGRSAYARRPAGTPGKTVLVVAPAAAS